MPLPLKPPSRIDPLNVPAFGMSWYANPGTGLSLVAYCGGGGSAKTGINNAVMVRAPDGDTRRIDTGEQVGVAVKIVQNPMTGEIWLIVALGKLVERYSLPSCEKRGQIEVGGDGVNAIAVNNMVSILACGCEDGEVKVYAITDDVFEGENLLYTCKGHTKTVCSIDFSCRGERMVSSAKDGTARVWQGEESIAELTCNIDGAKLGGKKALEAAAKAAKRGPQQVLVRGCAFGDLEGKYVITVASARRGSAFLSRWFETPEGFQCERTEISEVPMSAMSLSSDGALLALGSVNGSIILWSVDDWKPLKVFAEVHDLPITCIAARPFASSLAGEEDVQFHAISASADSRLAYLTLQKPVKEQKPGAFQRHAALLHNLLVLLAITYIVATPIYNDAQEKCGYDLQHGFFGAIKNCVIPEVLWAPASYPGVMSPPY